MTILLFLQNIKFYSSFHHPSIMRTKAPTHLVAFLLFCGSMGLLKAQFPSEKPSFPYTLSEPDFRYELPGELNEVSGICSREGGMLAMVQDESGRIYLYNTQQHSLQSIHHFREHGDFEGIEYVGDTAFVLRSDGTLFEVSGQHGGSMQVTSYPTFLTKDNDAEGLGYDADKGYLLIACKSSPSYEGQSYKGNRAVYAFDLGSRSLLPQPYLLINRDIIETKMEEQKFRPAGIAVHPISKDIYLVAASGQLLVVTDAHANIKWIKKLKKSIFRQPEGICFDPDGRMYICSEGGDKPGYVLEFVYKGE